LYELKAWKVNWAFQIHTYRLIIYRAMRYKDIRIKPVFNTYQAFDEECTAYCVKKLCPLWVADTVTHWSISSIHSDTE